MFLSPLPLLVLKRDNGRMRWLRSIPLALMLLAVAAHAQYAGFDKNTYPGDANLAALHKTFAFTGYWLNVPPGATNNSWTGKRAAVKSAGFGFLLLFNGRTEAQLKGADAKLLGEQDAQDAVKSARHEGFPAHARIFLDMEEGGRMLPDQVAYIFAWVDTVRAQGMRAGIYCSGIDVEDGGGKTISTARHLAEFDRDRAKTKHSEERLALWVANDACPPAPGCMVVHYAAAAGVPREIKLNTHVWQYAQSPRRMEFSAACPKNTDADGDCYAPKLPHSASSFVDLNVATSPDPSGGR